MSSKNPIKWTRRQPIILLSILVFLLLVGPVSAASNLHEGDHLVVDATHLPISPEPGQRFNMSLTVLPDLHFEWIRVYVCSITEAYCGAPVPAEAIAGMNDTYGNVSYKPILSGHLMGYKFLIKDDNGTFYKYPTENTTLGSPIVELYGIEYFSVQVQGNLSIPIAQDDDDDGLLFYPVYTLLSFVVVGIVVALVGLKQGWLTKP